ncbi:hypothetical protein C7974DRAFT_321746 [Boeremia exigua]|uniref:uncharacterized protein n=1 Tax=Boeremia exigua TaxID=749465 RepID=UPI001E8E6992|nr:uncharacterized protein C7974DRAFT_321746 [Boeremia exigua]KAH6613934.1 hypothetical protein C7974DRAFT_321746 [Boeremia exigua]
MPYNNTPIAPSKEVTGHVSLPLARVQKIIQADPERLTVTKNASFAIALATEMMIQHLAVTTHNVVKAERRPRRNIQYRDVSGAVSKTDNLEFLVDVVPKTTQYGAFRKRKAVEEGKEVEPTPPSESGPQTKEAKRLLARIVAETAVAQAAAAEVAAAKTAAVDTPSSGTQLDPLARVELVPETEAMDVDGAAGEDRVADSEGEEDPAAMQIEMEMRGPPRANGKGKEKEKQESVAAPPQISSGGFTAINGR